MINTVTNENCIEFMKSAARNRMELSHHINLEWVRTNSIIAMPAEFAGVLTDDEADSVATAFIEDTAITLLAINIDMAEYYELTPSKDDIRELLWQYGAFILLLINPETSATILFTPEEFMVVCGNEQFIKNTLHSSTCDAMDYFRSYSTSTDISPYIHELIVNAASRYEIPR